MELRPVRELQTDAGKREADHLSDLGVKDSSMVVLIDDDGAEMVTVNPWIYRRLTSKVGQANVFNPDYAVGDGEREAQGKHSG